MNQNFCRNNKYGIFKKKKNSSNYATLKLFRNNKPVVEQTIFITFAKQWNRNYYKRAKK